MYCEEGCKRLAMGIVKKALDDYTSAIKSLIKNPNDAYALYKKRTLEKWFRSEDYKILCDVDGEKLMKLILEKKFTKKKIEVVMNL